MNPGAPPRGGMGGAGVGGGRNMPHALVGAKVMQPPPPPMSSISGANAMNYAQQAAAAAAGQGGNAGQMANPKLTLPQAVHLISMRVTSIEKILAKEGMLKMMSDGTYEHSDGAGAGAGTGAGAGASVSAGTGGGSRIRADDLHMVLNRLNTVESSVSDLTREMGTLSKSSSVASAGAGAGVGAGAGAGSSRAIPPAVIQQLNAFKQGFQKQSMVIKQLSDELKATQSRVTDLENDIDSLSETMTQLMNNANNGGQSNMDAMLEGMDENAGAGMGMEEDGHVNEEVDALGVGMGIALEPYTPFGGSGDGGMDADFDIGGDIHLEIGGL